MALSLRVKTSHRLAIGLAAPALLLSTRKGQRSGHLSRAAAGVPGRMEGSSATTGASSGLGPEPQTFSRSYSAKG